MKKIVSILLSALFCLTVFVTPTVAKDKPNDCIPVFNSLEELYLLEEWPNEFYILTTHNANVNSVMSAGVGAYAKYVFESRKYQYSDFWGYHPQFSTWQFCDGYILSTEGLFPLEMSISVSYGLLSITIARTSSSGSIVVNADRTKASRPYVYGTVCYDIYRVEVYDSNNTIVSTASQRRFVKNSSTLGYGVKYK